MWYYANGNKMFSYISYLQNLKNHSKLHDPNNIICYHNMCYTVSVFQSTQEKKKPSKACLSKIMPYHSKNKPQSITQFTLNNYPSGNIEH